MGCMSSLIIENSAGCGAAVTKLLGVQLLYCTPAGQLVERNCGQAIGVGGADTGAVMMHRVC